MMEQRRQKLASGALGFTGTLTTASAITGGITFYSLAGACVTLAGIAFWFDM